MVSCDFIVVQANGRRFDPQTGDWMESAIAAYCTRASLYEIQNGVHSLVEIQIGLCVHSDEIC